MFVRGVLIYRPRPSMSFRRGCLRILKMVEGCFAEISLLRVPPAVYLEHPSTMQEEAVMRSRWLGRRFGSSDGGSAASKSRVGGDWAAAKERRPGASGNVGAKAGRLCLGIGDGSVRRQ
jgi:hypothetical protein